ncbi:MAG: hypothetical protein ACFFCQ_01305 [Promethearchaeota archaeon]
MSERITVRKKLVRFALREIKRNRAIKVEIFRFRSRSSLIRGRMPQLAVFSDPKGPKYAAKVNYKSGLKIYFFNKDGDGPFSAESHPAQVKKIEATLKKDATQIGIFPKPKKQITLSEISDTMNKIFKDVIAQVEVKTKRKIKNRPVISASEHSIGQSDFYFIPRSLMNSNELNVQLTQLAFSLLLEKKIKSKEAQMEFQNLLTYIFLERPDMKKILLEKWQPLDSLNQLNNIAIQTPLEELLNFLDILEEHHVPFNEETLPLIQGIAFQDIDKALVMVRTFYRRSYEKNWYKNDSLVRYLALTLIVDNDLIHLPLKIRESKECKLFAKLTQLRVQAFMNDWEYFTNCELETWPIVEDAIFWLLGTRGIQVRQEIHHLFFEVPTLWTIRIGNLSDVPIKVVFTPPKIRNIELVDDKVKMTFELTERSQNQLTYRIIPRRKGKITFPRLSVICSFKEREFVAVSEKINTQILED